VTYNHYDNHPTGFSHLSNDEFFAKFLPSSWDNCDNAVRQELLQEAVNRSAAINNEQGSCKVTLDQMDYNVMGGQCADRIRMNSNYFGQENQGTYLQETYGAPGMKALETALHEDRHAYQSQVVSGAIPTDNPEQKAAFANNQIEKVLIPMEKNSQETIIGSTYLNASGSVTNGYSLYLAQPVEADARRVSEHRVAEIVKSQSEILQSKLTADTLTSEERCCLENDLKELKSFSIKLEQRCFENQMKLASEEFGVDDLEKEVSNALCNMRNQMTLPVDPNVSKSVETMSVFSAIAQNMEPDLTTPSVQSLGIDEEISADSIASDSIVESEESDITEDNVLTEEDSISADSGIIETDNDLTVIRTDFGVSL